MTMIKFSLFLVVMGIIGFYTSSSDVHEFTIKDGFFFFTVGVSVLFILSTIEYLKQKETKNDP